MEICKLSRVPSRGELFLLDYYAINDRIYCNVARSASMRGVRARFPRRLILPLSLPPIHFHEGKIGTVRSNVLFFSFGRKRTLLRNVRTHPQLNDVPNDAQTLSLMSSRVIVVVVSALSLCIDVYTPDRSVFLRSSLSLFFPPNPPLFCTRPFANFDELDQRACVGSHRVRDFLFFSVFFFIGGQGLPTSPGSSDRFSFSLIYPIFFSCFANCSTWHAQYARARFGDGGLIEWSSVCAARLFSVSLSFECAVQLRRE